MPMLEYSVGQAFTSTGVSAWYDAYTARAHTFVFESNAASTGAFQMQTRLKNGTNTAVLSSGNITASSVMTYTFVGPYYQTRVRMKTITGTVTARWFGI